VGTSLVQKYSCAKKLLPVERGSFTPINYRAFDAENRYYVAVISTQFQELWPRYISVKTHGTSCIGAEKV
jgi:hypothetical protein